MELKEKEPRDLPSTSAKGLETKEAILTHHPVPIKGRRRNLGRQARKRRKKYLEVEAAAAAFVEATTAANTDNNEATHQPKASNSNSWTSILPTDRSYVLDNVRQRSVLTEDDRRDLIRQLGYLPGNALKVVARIKDAFSTEDIERLFAAVEVVVKPTTKGLAKAKVATIVRSDVGTKSFQSEENDIDNTPNKTKDSNGEIPKTKFKATLIHQIMNEPLVVKLYPLVLRDESSSTKRRRKRRRDESEHSTEPLDSKVDGANDDDTPSQGSSTGATNPLPLLEPFPTIFWVTHPLIKALISKLELDRLNVRYEQRLAERSDRPSSPLKSGGKSEGATGLSSSLVSMRRAHRAYGKERRELLSVRDLEYVRSRGWYTEEKNPPSSSSSPKPRQTSSSTAPFGDGCGVAGIRNPSAVKCLHAHAAHYWSGNGDNVVGRWVWEELKRTDRSFFRETVSRGCDNQ